MIITIKAKPLTVEGFAPYGKAIIIPDDNNPERPTDRFNFWPKLSLLKCDSGVFQVGVSTFFRRPFRTMNLEKHYKTEEFMSPLVGSFVLLFCKTKDMKPGSEPDYDNAEAFIVHPNQCVVVNKEVWHWSPMPFKDNSTMLCIFAEDTHKGDLEIQPLPKGQIVEIKM